MELSKSIIMEFFQIGENILTGAERTTFELIEITDQYVRIKPTQAKNKTKTTILHLDKLSIVISHFHTLNPMKIESSVNTLLKAHNLPDYTNETYLYGFARDVIDRSNSNEINYYNMLDRQVRTALKLSTEERNRKINERTAKGPVTSEAIIKVFRRDPNVIAEILLRAKGRCEFCKKQAPFIRQADKTPYLEVHHKKFLCDGGTDTIENAVALCPNCHRRMHYGVK